MNSTKPSPFPTRLEDGKMHITHLCEDLSSNLRIHVNLDMVVCVTLAFLQ